MAYLKVESGEVTKTIPNIRQEYSNVSFPGGKPNQEFLDLHSLVEVTHVTINHPNDKVENVDPYQDGDKWYTQKVTAYVAPSPSPDTPEQKWKMVRFERYEKLRECCFIDPDDIRAYHGNETIGEFWRGAYHYNPEIFSNQGNDDLCPF